METRRILAINPGSTSTKIAVFQGDKSVFLKNIKHSNEELAQFGKISEQFEFRKNIIMKELVDAEIQIDLIEAVVGRGGLVKPIESGIYSVNERLKEDLRIGVLGEHASNLGGLIADNIAQALPRAKAYIADPVVVDEMIDVARISGHPEFQRVSIFHALNQKAIGRAFAQSVDKKYEEINVIVAHLGGGISVGAHCKGRVIDVNNALDGEGPFSPERSGTLPAGALAKLCFSGDYTLEDVKKMIKGEGGLVAHLGTNDAYDVELKAKAGDANAKLIQDAMSYQVGKSIGEMAAVLKGKVDGILLTGGIAHNPDLVNYIKEMVSFIAPVVVYPGEDEMKALAMNGYMVLRGEIQPREYC
ncbi:MULTISPECIES: butyrate kinase [Labilibaculum]|uniref:Probable butyrate kinase n=2 Tax=Labilibaculum TaxID=2060722 RepID=A0A7M4D788_9BACT|nr:MULTISPECIES: butyrate kinase [Labilibaculum]MUP38517.1 butyrate kinase [Labilibaculum euxinus]MVB07722.1 butyrate kinase [Labilibaculum euxinus]PKQ65250.1 butyrate kinase [Labilibaculum manganireducens]